MYASPELLAGEQIDGRSDLWSLGVILGEMGFKGKAVKKCLKRDRVERYSTAAELFEDLNKNFAIKSVNVAVSLCFVGLAVLSLSLLREESETSDPSVVETVVPVNSGLETVQTAEDETITEDPADTIFINKEPAPAEEKKNPEEYIDNASLDALLNAASGEIK